MMAGFGISGAAPSGSTTRQFSFVSYSVGYTILVED
jgi:hypothetical protein